MAGWAHLRLMTSSHENRRHHRRQTTSPKPHRQDREDAPPVRLPHVVVTVDEPGTLRVTVDGVDLPAPQDGQPWTRAQFADMLDLVTDDRRVAVRVEVHESDGSTFTDLIHAIRRPAPDPLVELATEAPAPGETPMEPATPEGPVEVTADGFTAGEEITVALAIATTAATADGRARAQVDPSQTDAGEILLVGRVSGTIAARGLS